MKVYSIQHINVLEKLNTKNKIFCDRRYICSKDFKDSYSWYIKRAQELCPLWENNKPFWVWIDKPDLRKWRYFRDERKGKIEELVLLELEIDPDLILISNFELWHHVLNKIYLPYTKKEDENFDKKINNRKYENLPMSLKKRIEDSWDRCLVLDDSYLEKFEDIFSKESRQLQGIIPFLSKQQIISIKRFQSLNRA